MTDWQLAKRAAWWPAVDAPGSGIRMVECSLHRWGEHVAAARTQPFAGVRGRGVGPGYMFFVGSRSGRVRERVAEKSGAVRVHERGHVLMCEGARWVRGMSFRGASSEAYVRGALFRESPPRESPRKVARRV